MENKAKKAACASASPNNASNSKRAKNTTQHTYTDSCTAAESDRNDVVAAAAHTIAESSAVTSSAPLSNPVKTAELSATARTTSANIPTTPSTKNNDPIRPQTVPYLPSRWKTCQDGVILYRDIDSGITSTAEKCDGSKSGISVMGLDLGGTLFDSAKQYPNSLADYELWNADVVPKLQAYHDQGHVLIIFINQGGIKRATTGKIASKVKELIEWLAKEADRPMAAFVSTNTKGGFHKPAPDMWSVAEKMLGPFNVATSFFVGDSVDKDDGTIGDDEGFARNVGKLKGAVLKFHTPSDLFGPSSKECRLEHSVTEKQMAYSAPPTEALQIRAALTCGFLKGPILLILCGPQGSGKSYFCEQLTRANTERWAHFSQDTISNGKPGKREAVERAAQNALYDGISVVVDRMHIDEVQRAYFVQLARTVGVPAHAVVLTTPKEVIMNRVVNRENHIVQGEQGSKLAQASWASLVIPTYEEGFSLVSASSTPEGSQSIVEFYRNVTSLSSKPVSMPSSIPMAFSCPCNMAVPSISLGTFRLGKRVARDVVSTAVHMGFQAIDTAPTYNNDELVGAGMGTDSFCIAKIPKSATTSVQVREEFAKSLSKLKLHHVDLLLLHWPCDVIAAGTIKEVWTAMEDFVIEGTAKALGVCNFNVGALRILLPLCTIQPVVNQIERHPLLPQWELVDFCAQHDILLQAHTPLGQGKSDLFEHPTIQRIASRAGVSPARVVLEWNLRQLVAVVPKCISEEHMADILSARSSPILMSVDMESLQGITERKRFVAPSFMYGNEAYHWGKHMSK